MFALVFPSRIDSPSQVCRSFGRVGERCSAQLASLLTRMTTDSDSRNEAVPAVGQQQHDQLNCVLRVDVSLSEADIEAALSSLLGGATRVSRFHKTRGEKRRPLPLCRVVCDDSHQRELLLRGVVLGGVLCRVEPDHSGPTSAAALGRVRPPPDPAKDGRLGTKLIQQRARAIARSVRVHVALTANVCTHPEERGVEVRLALARGSSGRGGGAAAATGLGRGRMPDSSPRELAWPLHAAAACDNAAEVSRLLSVGAAAAAAKPNGTTPLMVAAMHGAEHCARLLLDAGAVPGRRSHARLTAADYARTHGHPCLATELEAAAQAAAAAASEGGPRCHVCKEVVKRRSSLHFLLEGAEHEANPLVANFCSSAAAKALCAPAWHTLSNMKALRKEVTESACILECLERSCAGQTRIHLVDLCCGKGLTTALAAHNLPLSTTTAVDLLRPTEMPHFEARDIHT